ncbi:unnamed protein product [Soboliphyme baturini]|uniref:glutamate synthase (ferredoxin) n=1 Tax=Soboliphyme baturini TaxID=241478 RepID=A0A183J848_9BILA|nr:unnamed protein product [Soboliphyme baturini]
MLERMAHRSACACDGDSGDGAGVMTAIPHELYANDLKANSVHLPERGRYATGLIFFDKKTYKQGIEAVNDIVESCSFKVLFWRSPPVDSSVLGSESRKNEPCIRQIFVVGSCPSDDEMQRKVGVYNKCIRFRF